MDNENAIKKLLETAENAKYEDRYEDAVCAYEKAADLGDVSSMVNLGDLYNDGIFIEQDYNKAFMWYKKAAENDDPISQINLGDCYLEGRGTEQDLEKAIMWYRKAAALDYSGGLTHLGCEYYTGSGCLEQNCEEAFKWFSESAASGNIPAIYLLGDCYYNGKGTEQNYAEAVKLFKEAAEYENADAQNALGNCYSEGNGVEKNLNEAARWYEKAAMNGSDLGQMNFALCCIHGEGTEENLDRAFYWLNQSAAHGNAVAKRILNEAFYDTLDDDEDSDEADDEDFDKADNKVEEEILEPYKVRYIAEFKLIPQIIECDPGYVLSWLSENRENAANGLYKEAFEEITDGAYPFGEKDFSVEVYSRSNCRNDAVIIITYPENTESEMICLKGCAAFVKNEKGDWVSRYITVETDTYNGNNGRFCFLGEFRGDNHVNMGIVPKGKNKLIERIEEIVFGSKSRSRKLVKVN